MIFGAILMFYEFRGPPKKDESRICEIRGRINSLVFTWVLFCPPGRGDEKNADSWGTSSFFFPPKMGCFMNEFVWGFVVNKY